MNILKEIVIKPVIGDVALTKLNQVLSGAAYKDARLFILVDENTINECLPKFEAIVKCAQGAEIIEIPAGEKNKEIDICKGIWLSLAQLGADRNSVMINLGGGVVTDVGGFAASTFMRGIRYFNVPTSLMGMADASIGGKTGIDMERIKNLVGVFGKPEGVFIYGDFLKTLPEKELRSGYAEILKHSLISDEDVWESHKSKSFSRITNWIPLIRKSVEIKMSVIELDPVEKDFRKVLNFGHTVGHAIESVSLRKNKKHFLHGEAVAIGIICEAYLSHKLTGLSEMLLGEISDFVLSVFPWRKLPGSPDDIYKLMKSDKKNKGIEIRFTLLAGIGQVMINQKCPESLVMESLQYYKSLKN